MFPTLRRQLSSSSQESVKTLLRNLLRESAQPVTVVCARLPPSLDEQGETRHQYHGTTLSSFTSIAMDPFPLVAFSLRVPSRMDIALRACLSTTAQSTPQPEQNAVVSEKHTHLTLNILSSTQAHLARLYSSQHHHFDGDGVEYTLNEGGIPILGSTVGALSCVLACPPISLSGGLGSSVGGLETEIDGKSTASETSTSTSELYIARVISVHTPPQIPSSKPLLPLVYHKRSYTTTR